MLRTCYADWERHALLWHSYRKTIDWPFCFMERQLGS